MNILIADTFPLSHISSLEELAHDVTFEPGLDETTISRDIGDNEILIVRSTRVSASALEAGNKLKLVIRAGAGTNTIDKDRARELGISVCNVPGANAIAVAELAMGLIVSIDRNIPANVSDLKVGVWNKKKYSQARGLYGRRIGILGLGAIGFAVSERARAFGMDVYSVAKSGRSQQAVDRIADAGITLLPDMDELLATCDVVSLHMPSTPETRHMVNQTFLDQMQEGAILVNTSRGDLVDESALIEAMNTRGIRAGLDVYDNEPGAGDDSFESDLANHPGVCGTHHIGASTNQAQVAVADGVLDVIKSYTNNKLINCVN
jgi:D-3-phosphoglycerate dehydrogenase